MLETSRTNRNLVRSIWYDRRVAILSRARTALIPDQGLPVRAHVSGPVFQKHYSEVARPPRRRGPAAVWVSGPTRFSTNRTCGGKRNKPPIRASRTWTAWCDLMVS